MRSPNKRPCRWFYVPGYEVHQTCARLLLNFKNLAKGLLNSHALCTGPNGRDAGRRTQLSHPVLILLLPMVTKHSTLSHKQHRKERSEESKAYKVRVEIPSDLKVSLLSTASGCEDHLSTMDTDYSYYKIKKSNK